MRKSLPGAPSRPRPAISIARDVRQRMDGLALLRALPDRCAALAFCDPQYRAVLDKLKFGNEGARQKDRAKLQQMSEYEIARFVEEIERVLKPSGHLMLWVDKFIVGEGSHKSFFRYADEMKRVDLIHWNKGRAGMGRRARCRSEYLIVAQKLPLRAKGVWIDHRIDDAWVEHADRGRHPHAKPFVLTERLIRAVTKRGDLVVDPCAGGYGVLDACLHSGRHFVGCDVAETT